MMSFYKSICVLCLCLLTQIAFTQVITPAISSNKKGVFYFSFGSHLAFYSKSNIQLRREGNEPLDIVLEKARAHDDGGIVFGGKAPQYSYAAGYYSKKKNFGIEYQFDHIKYIMRDNQTVHMVGQIEGKQYNTDTLVGNNFIHLEHCDGGNYAMLNYVKWKNITYAEKEKSKSLDLTFKAGAGVVIPKTESIVMGKLYHDHYALSGYVIGVDAGLRFNFLKNVFAESYFKGAYANYRRFLIADGSGRQHWFSMQFNLMLGCQL